ncbi:hypothetical protein V9T40_003219 [Parthenolecanium corni]|uniref:Uncharacterized protein n=1 Tax=Parthenolecanium corni TaxID=536013 RepID=A0AAN9TUX3_9HEMI
MIPLRITCDVLGKFVSNSSNLPAEQCLPWISETSHDLPHLNVKPQQWMSPPCQCCKEVSTAVKMSPCTEFVTLSSIDRAYNQIKNFSYSKIHQKFGKRKRHCWTVNIADISASFRSLSGRRSLGPSFTTL